MIVGGYLLVRVAAVDILIKRFHKATKTGQYNKKQLR
jgi:hypothetical protein